MKLSAICVLAILFLCSCGNNEGTRVLDDIDEDSLAQRKKINSRQDIQVTLQKEPRELVSQWLPYITAQDEMRSLAQAEFDEVVAKASTYAKIFTELKNTVPVQLQSNAVLSRILVLETKAGILEQLTNRQTLKREEVISISKELPQDFENFKLQLNELFLKTPDQFEIELDDRLDSLQKANELDLPEELQPVNRNQ